MKRFGTCLLVLTALVLSTAVGCEKEDEAAEAPATQPAHYSGAGGAPTFGTPSGMGFSTGDAAHSDGQGSGLMGFHGTGAMGASGAITDKHEVLIPESLKPTTAPVLPIP